MKAIKMDLLPAVFLLLYGTFIVFEPFSTDRIFGQERELTDDEKYKTYTPVSIDESRVYGPEKGKKIKIFILSGQSNMEGQGASYKLDDDCKRGTERVLMFENGKWQPLRPLKRRFGPELSFGPAIAEAWQGETIGIVKQAIGGTGIRAWHPNWTKEQADRSNDGDKGNLWKALTEKVSKALVAADGELMGFIWMQGGKDMMKEDLGKEYLKNLTDLVQGLRKKFGVPGLPFVLGSYRLPGFPDDLSGMKEKVIAAARRKGMYYVLQAQYEAEKVLAPANMVPLRNLERWPNDAHYNTKGQLDLGRLFAQGYLELVKGQK